MLLTGSFRRIIAEIVSDLRFVTISVVLRWRASSQQAVCRRWCDQLGDGDSTTHFRVRYPKLRSGDPVGTFCGGSVWSPAKWERLMSNLTGRHDSKVIAVTSQWFRFFKVILLMISQKSSSKWVMKAQRIRESLFSSKLLLHQSHP